jgi:hypothetical protein
MTAASNRAYTQISCVRAGVCGCNRAPVQAVTQDRAAAESSINTPVIASHAYQRVAAVAQKGGYRDSRETGMRYEKLMCAWRGQRCAFARRAQCVLCAAKDL